MTFQSGTEAYFFEIGCPVRARGDYASTVEGADQTDKTPAESAREALGIPAPHNAPPV